MSERKDTLFTNEHFIAFCEKMVLLRLDYDLPKYGADGSFGAETQAAVTAFQKRTASRLTVSTAAKPTRR